MSTLEFFDYLVASEANPRPSASHWSTFSPTVVLPLSTSPPDARTPSPVM